MGEKPLARERAKELRRKKIITYDIETGSKPGEAFFREFNAGMIYDGSTFTEFHSMEEFLVWSLQYPGYTFLAHNAKAYELNYLLDPLRELVASDSSYTVETICQGKTIIQFVLTRRVKKQKLNSKTRRMEDVVKTQTWKYGDTVPIFVSSLDTVTKCYAPEHAKMSGAIDFETEVFDISNPLHRQYLERDCSGLYHAYQRMEELMFETFGCGLGMTAGSTAMKAFKASIPEGKAYFRMHKDVDVMSREAYKGGIVLPGLTTRAVYDVTVHDAKAAYGYHMKTKLYPVGVPFHTFKYHPGKMGVYRAIVYAPTTLPVGFISERGSSILPLGSFEATITTPEIEFGEKHGYRFIIQEGYVWEQTEAVFKTFAEKCEELETTVVMVDGKKTYPYKPVAKLMRNSLYGKFGTKDRAESIAFTSAPKDHYEMLIDPRSGNIVDGVFSYTEEIDEPYMIPIWAAYITAYQRVYLMELVYLAYEMGARSIYCDTDSMTIETVVVDRMKALGYLQSDGKYGSWECEGRGDLIALAPKVYCLAQYDESYANKYRAKGLPIMSGASKLRGKIYQTKEDIRSWKMFEDISNGTVDTFEYDTSNSPMSRLKNPRLEIYTTRSRKISDIRQSAGWNYDVETATIFPIVRNYLKEEKKMVY